MATGRRTRHLTQPHAVLHLSAAATAGHPLSHPLSPSRLLQPARKLQDDDVCDPCAANVPGDFNGDCKFLASDIDYLSQLIISRLDFVNGLSTIDPLDNPSEWVVNDVDACPESVKYYANPSLDNIQVQDPTDPRFNKPSVTAMDTQVPLSVYLPCNSQVTLSVYLPCNFSPRDDHAAPTIALPHSPLAM